MVRINFIAAALLFSAVASWAQQTSSTEDSVVKITKAPYLPMLVSSRNDRICNAQLQTLRHEFTAGIHELGAQQPKPLAPPPWDPVSKLDGKHNVKEVLLSTPGKYAILMFEAPFNWRGNWFGLVLVNSKNTYENFLALLQNVENSTSALESAVKATPGTRFLEVGENNEWSWVESTVAETDGVTVVRTFGFKNDDKLFSANSSGDVEILCQWISPSESDEPLATYGLQNTEATNGETATHAYREILRKMLGVGGNCTGTMASDYALLNNGDEAVRRALTQPWSIGQDSLDDANVSNYLLLWSSQGLWERKLYKAFTTQQPATENALALHYKINFGANDKDAVQLAKRWIGIMLTSYINVGIGNNTLPTTEIELRAYIETWAKSARPDYQKTPQIVLNRALTLQMSPRLVGHLLQRGASINPTLDSLGAQEPPLAAAVASKRLTAYLLKRGADINWANLFGKTPIMYAAHHNQPEVIAYLLKRGADTSLATTLSKECGQNVQRGGRTALTYALENGGLKTIKLLLDDAAMKGLPLPATAQQDLRNNTALTGEERSAISGQLSQLMQRLN